MKNQKIFELYTDDNKSKYSSGNPMNILKFVKKKIKNKVYTKCTSTAATTEVVWKIPNRKKISYQHFNLCEAEIFLDEKISPIYWFFKIPPLKVGSFSKPPKY